MNLITRIWRSSLGKKYVMAITGCALFLFVIGHLLGNLQVFGPPDMINTYAHFLKSKSGLLWGVRLGLLACVGLHIAAAVTLTALNKDARPEGYAGGSSYGSTVQSRYMLVSGLVILAFVVYHLAHFTALLPGINGQGDFRKLTAILHGEQVADVYAMMILGFQVWWVTAFYLIAQGLLFMHLGHGLAAMFQSVGFRNHVWWPRIQAFAKVASIALFVGYALIPVSIFMRVVGAEYAEKARHQFSQSLPPPDALVPGVTGKEAK
jgi:succinate dehydrogenase / fumarate reductase cytochrome b subunit